MANTNQINTNENNGTKKFLDRVGLETFYNLLQFKFADTYADKEHYHDDRYSKIDHDHDTVYSKLGHDHDNVYAKKDWVDEELSYKLGATQKAVSSYTADSASTAETANISNKVSHPLTIKHGTSVKTYDGHEDITIDLVDLIEVTYAELVDLKNNSKLNPGSKYCIIDYNTIVEKGEFTSAGHSFDIIVEAISENVLSENAQACRCFNSKRDHGVETNSDIFNYTDKNDWYYYGHAYGGPTLPDDVLKLKNEANIDVVSTDYGKIQISDVNQYLNKIFRITLQGTDGNGNKIRGFGATLIKDRVIQDYDFGFRDEFYLRLPESATTGEYVLRFYAVGTESDMNDGYAGARAEVFDATSHFNNSDLNAWKLKYCLDNDSNRFDWANSSGKGVIYYMKDEFDNEAPYDFKNILINGKYTFNYQINGVDYDGSVKYGNICFGNKLCSDATAETSTNKPGLPKIVFNNTSENAICKFNTFSNNAWNISFGNGCYYNEFIGKCENISLGNNCFMNVFHEYCESNTLKDGNTNNTFGNNCTNNTLYEGCSHNTFGNNCTNNILKNECSYNKFDTFCANNYLDLYCNDNTFGNNCTGNKFANTCTNNKLGSNCIGNMFGVNCVSNELDNYCEANILGCNSSWQYPENISDVTEGSCIGNKFGNNCVKIYLQNACMYNVFAANCGVDKTLTDTKVGNNFGRGCEGNTFGIYCTGNTFGDNCSYNNFDEYAQYNTFGSSCQSNIFGIYAVNCLFGDYVLRCKVGSKSNGCKISTNSNGTTLLNNIKLVDFGNECGVNLYVNNTSTTYLQNYRIANGLTGNIEITGNNPRGRSYITSIGKDSSGVIVQKCLEDFKSSISTTYSAGTLTISLI
jgi:hypothetical protein